MTNTIQSQELPLKTDGKSTEQNRKFINEPEMANLFLTGPKVIQWGKRKFFSKCYNI